MRQLFLLGETKIATYMLKNLQLTFPLDGIDIATVHCKCIRFSFPCNNNCYQLGKFSDKNILNSMKILYHARGKFYTNVSFFATSRRTIVAMQRHFVLFFLQCSSIFNSFMVSVKSNLDRKHKKAIAVERIGGIMEGVTRNFCSFNKFLTKTRKSCTFCCNVLRQAQPNQQILK